MTLLISDICSWFHKQQGATRLDTVVSLLQMLYPLELQFVGVCLEDLMRSENHRLRDVEQRLNLPEIVACLTDLNDSRCRASLIVALSLLKGTNYSTATAVCKILFEFYVVYRQMPRTKDVLDELLLLLTMVKYHPAFKFDQKTNIANLCDDILNFINQNQTSLPLQQQSAPTATSSSVPSTPLENGPTSRSQNGVEDKDLQKCDNVDSTTAAVQKHFLQNSVAMKKSSDENKIHQRNQKNHYHHQQEKNQNRAGVSGAVINHYHHNNNNTSSSDRAPRNHNYHARAASSPSCRSQSYKTPSAAAVVNTTTTTRWIISYFHSILHSKKNVSNAHQNPTPSNRHDSSSNNNEYVFINSRYKYNGANNGAGTPESGSANLAVLDQQQRNSCTPPTTSRPPPPSRQQSTAAETSRPQQQQQNYDAAGGDNQMQYFGHKISYFSLRKS
uniref:Uncharacterized protein n=1 Tax=Romanomermis culicivorax TaxID=13658 RepID=A0A915K035_ROMCU